MRLLIVDDNKPLAELTSWLLRWIDQRAQYIETISLAGDLESAMRLLPEHDAVLCDGQFPFSSQTCSTGDEWRAVHRAARLGGMAFILYSGCPRILEAARFSDVPAIAKPARIEKIYEMLTELCPEVRSANVRDD